MKRFHTAAILLLLVALFAQQPQIALAFPPVNCTPGLGTVVPPPLCTAEKPCNNLIAKYEGKFTTIATPMFDDPNMCKDRWIKNLGPGYTKVSDPYVVLNIERSNTRYYELTKRRVYCEYMPPAASVTNKVPLVIFIHGSGGNASNYLDVPWRAWAAQMGFAVAGTQAMNRHWPASGVVGPGEDGTKNDFYYRNLTDSDDIAFFDTLIDSLVATNRIDRTRIYLSGWSNGCHFSHFYAVLRSGSTDAGSAGNPVRGTTPAGNKIAAVACFSAADPFRTPGWEPTCAMNPYPKSTVPILTVSRLCDVVVCTTVDAWMTQLRTIIGSRNATWWLLDAADAVYADPAAACSNLRSSCTPEQDASGHIVWPTGVHSRMIDFLWSFQSSTETEVSQTTTAGASTSPAPASQTAAPTAVSPAAQTTAAPTTTAAPSSSPSATTTTAAPTEADKLPPGLLFVQLARPAQGATTKAFSADTFRKLLAAAIGYPEPLLSVSQPDASGRVTVALLGTDQAQIDAAVTKADNLNSTELASLGATEISDGKTAAPAAEKFPLMYIIIAAACGGALLLGLIIFCVIKKRSAGPSFYVDETDRPGAAQALSDMDIQLVMQQQQTKRGVSLYTTL